MLVISYVSQRNTVMLKRRGNSLQLIRHIMGGFMLVDR